MTRYLLRRLLQTVPVLFGVSLLAFAIMHVVPGDPVRLIAGPDAPESVVQRVRAELGLERPLHVQYLSFLGRAIQGDLGRSLRSRAPVIDEILLSRILYGARLSLLVGVIATGIGASVGILSGLLAGYFPRVESVVMRTMDVLLAFPSILLAIAIVAALGPSLPNVMIAVGVRSIPSFARLSRSMVLGIRELEFVQGAQALGAGHPRILFRHILPNSISPLLVFSSMQVATAILLAAILSFLGLGVQPPTPEWGKMVSDGRSYLMEAPHVSLFPGLAIFVAVMGFNCLGDGLRDALDPRMGRVAIE